jgi:hypothetical protein
MEAFGVWAGTAAEQYRAVARGYRVPDPAANSESRTPTFRSVPACTSTPMPCSMSAPLAGNELKDPHP